MQGIWNKLNFKTELHNIVMILNSPESFQNAIDELKTPMVLQQASPEVTPDFFLFFVKEKSEINRIASELLLENQSDILVWFCYPKASSKAYTCDFNRDTGWDFLNANGYRGVRQVAIDQDWSALRFRREQYIGTNK